MRRAQAGAQMYYGSPSVSIAQVIQGQGRGFGIHDDKTTTDAIRLIHRQSGNVLVRPTARFALIDDFDPLQIREKTFHIRHQLIARQNPNGTLFLIYCIK